MLHFLSTTHTPLYSNHHFVAFSVWTRAVGRATISRERAPADSAPKMPKEIKTDFSIRPFASVNEFEAFLAAEHATAEGIHLKFAKKGSGIPSISWAEAVEVALCYGWIDGRSNTIDEQWWMIRFTPRRAKSIWSQKNVGTVARLIEEGRMRPAGLAAVEAAKADGRWDRAYAGPASITVPSELKAALAKSPAANAYWESLKKSERYGTLHRIQTASDAVRAKTIAAMVEMLASGQHPGAKSTTAAHYKKVSTNGIKKASKKTTKPVATPRVEQEKYRREGLRKRNT